MIYCDTEIRLLYHATTLYIVGKGRLQSRGFAFTFHPSLTFLERWHCSALLRKNRANNFKHASKHVDVEKLAYLRKEKETFEIDYPLTKIWASIPKTIASLEWTLEEIDDTAHHAKAKTKKSFMSYASTVTIDAAPVNKKTTRVTVTAETPVTTITSVADFGRTQHRIELFFEALAKQLTSQKPTR
jgi:hypothetical protein